MYHPKDKRHQTSENHFFCFDSSVYMLCYIYIFCLCSDQSAYWCMWGGGRVQAVAECISYMRDNCLTTNCMSFSNSCLVGKFRKAISWHDSTNSKCTVYVKPHCCLTHVSSCLLVFAACLFRYNVLSLIYLLYLLLLPWFLCPNKHTIRGKTTCTHF